MDSRDREIGRRVGYWRTRRGLTRQRFADLVGRSVSWVDKVEAGHRSLLRLPMLEAVAEILQVDVAVLTQDDFARRGAYCPDTTEVQAIRAALGSYGVILGGPCERGTPPDLTRLQQQVDHACAAWLSAHFTTVSRVLPTLIAGAQRAVEAGDRADRVPAVRCLVMVYRLASSTLLKFDSTEIAWLAADRAMAVARSTDDTICLARATRSVARAMTETGQRRDAIDALVTMADRMEPELRGGDRQLLSLYGMLLLPAEIAAAHEGDARLALDMHERAGEIARRLGSTYSDPVTVFGVANVALHRLAALVRLGEGGEAVEFASSAIDAPALMRLPRERRASYLLDLAAAHNLRGRPDEAVRALVGAEEVAPQEVRCRPVAHALIRRLLGTTRGQAAGQLRLLAGRIGVVA